LVQTIQKLALAADGTVAEFRHGADEPPVKDSGDVNLVCGKCQRVLFEGYGPGKNRIGRGATLECETCGAVNVHPDEPASATKWGWLAGCASA
jgi:hypothetical protein